MKPLHAAGYAGLTVAAGAAVLYAPGPAAVTGGLLLALVLPGYAATEAILRGRKLARVERVVLAPALSLAVLVLAGLVIYVLGLRLDRIAWTTATVGVSLLGLAAATVPKSWTRVGTRIVDYLVDDDEEVAAAGKPAIAEPRALVDVAEPARTGAGSTAVASVPVPPPPPMMVAIKPVAPPVDPQTPPAQEPAAGTDPAAAEPAASPAASGSDATAAPDSSAGTATQALDSSTGPASGTAAGPATSTEAEPGAETVRIVVPPRGKDDTLVLPAVVLEEQAQARADRPVVDRPAPAPAKSSRRPVWQAAPLLLVIALLGGAGWLSFDSSRSHYTDATVTALSAAPSGPVDAAGTRAVAVTVTGLVAADGPYSLIATGSTASATVTRTIAVSPTGTWTQSLTLPGSQRITITLHRAGETAAYRTLYLAAVE